ncbi:hypothetical protein BsWGS_19731 [Bradybaena similaris]
MVKTRHSGDVDAESPPTFISLSNEKSRHSLKSDDPAGVGGQSGRAYGDRGDGYNIFDEKVVESRLRPRIGPRAYNYIDVDSSDEEIIRRHHHFPVQAYSSERLRARYSRSEQMKNEMLEKQERPRRMLRRQPSPHDYTEEQSTEEEDDNSRRGRPRREKHLERHDDKRKQISSRHLQLSLEENEGNETNRKSLGKRQRQSAEEDDDDNTPSRSLRQHPTAEDDEEHLIRRSSRARRQIYDTLNQSYLVSIPGQSRHGGDNSYHSDTKDQDSDDNKEFSDMYSRVKRKRVQVKRNMYGVPVSDESGSEQEDEQEEDQEEDIANRNENNNNKDDQDEEEISVDEDDDDDEAGENMKDVNNSNRRTVKQKNLSLDKKRPGIVKSYSLRKHKPRTDLYKAPVKERRKKRSHGSAFQTKKGNNQAYYSPAQKRTVRKLSAFHSSSSSSTSESSDSDSSDEKRFSRRQAKSLEKARSRMMPLNINANARPTTSRKKRVKAGSCLDIEPMAIDSSITFNSIGGLGKHIRALKEMIVFPLLYKQVFQRFKVDPPRGVLFYGPPGTGKTLVARALANECSQGNQQVAFFMRKGADCMSKWVGESERQLRLLFDQAYKYRPSIIFFDEIDGLAPVRSSRQDQIHSSIVSTLLALMDGLDSRGEIVVIGATNRIDSLDPALRRPGRFDREFLFHLPSLEARKQILKIHTEGWIPKLNDDFISELAEKCVGYCGADLKALCTEAAILALRRRYPQIYYTDDKLQLDASSINVSARDFFDAVKNIIPTSQRAVNTPACALPARVSPLLQRILDRVMGQLRYIFPPCLAEVASTDVAAGQAHDLAQNGIIWDEFASDEDEDTPSIFVEPTSTKGSKANKQNIDEQPSTSHSKPTYLNFASSATSRPSTFRPRMILVGKAGQGQSTYIAPAIIHKMENLPVNVLDLPTLYAVTAKTPEESCANVFHEAKRKCPGIIYMPHINQWWDVMGETLQAALLTLIQNLDPSLPLLLLATSEQPYDMLDPALQSLFTSNEVVKMTDPSMEERKTFFQDLLLKQAIRPPPQKKQVVIEPIPKCRKRVQTAHSKSVPEAKRRRIQTTVKKPRKTVARKVQKPTTTMVLRSHRSRTAKLNRNQSARQSEPRSKPVVRKSSKPAPSRQGMSQAPNAPIPQVGHAYASVLRKRELRNKSSPMLVCGTHQMLYQSHRQRRDNKKRSRKLAVPLNINRLRRKKPSRKHTRSVKGMPKTKKRVGCCSRRSCCRRSKRSCCQRSKRSNSNSKETAENIAQRMLEVLPKAPPPKPRELTEEELSLLLEKEELTLMELRIFLRDVLNKLGNDKKFSIFAKPVNVEDAADYYDIIEHPMDLSTMMAKIDLHEYTTVRSFMNDIDLICSNALEYNPNRGPMDRIIRHRACALKDTAYAIIKTDLDKDFEKSCIDIEESRQRRDHKSTTVPNFYYTKPNGQLSCKSVMPSYLDNSKPARSIPKPEGERFSRRVRGMNIDPVPPLEAVEKVYKMSRTGSSPEESKDNEPTSAVSQRQNPCHPEEEETCSSASQLHSDSRSRDEKVAIITVHKVNVAKKIVPTSSSNSKKKKNKCVWCKPRRKRPKFSIVRPSVSHVSGDEGAEDEMSHEEEMDIEKAAGDVHETNPLQLVVDTTEHEESKDIRSPGRMSTRSRSPAHVSPVATCPSRISTRRSSLSPHPIAATQGSSSTQPQGYSDAAEPSKDSEPMIVDDCAPEDKQPNTGKPVTDSIEGPGNSSEALVQQSSLVTDLPERPKVVKRLNLESVAIDSGVGSSVDSNGDSRDSMDHRGEGDPGARTVAEDSNQNCNKDLINSAKSVVKNPTQKVVVDNNRLVSLLNRLVARTEGYSVESLEKIHSHLSQVIFLHRHEYDKSAMIAELSQIVDEYTHIETVEKTSSTRTPNVKAD